IHLLDISTYIEIVIKDASFISSLSLSKSLCISLTSSTSECSLKQDITSTILNLLYNKVGVFIVYRVVSFAIVKHLTVRCNSLKIITTGLVKSKDVLYSIILYNQR